MAFYHVSTFILQLQSLFGTGSFCIWCCKLMFVAHSPCLVILSEAVQSTAKSKDLRTEYLLKNIENA